ncbi:MAG: hypothetical protein AAF934_03565 [Bacteroidota bacterium]
MSTTPTYIDFIQYHQPALESGEYRVTIDQTLDDTGSKISSQNYQITKTFYVSGERFHILPEHIKSAFPPPHSLGAHSNVFPHLMLSRNTLPWEREAVPGATATPWMALLVIHESEAGDVTEATVTLSDLTTASSVSPFFPGISDLEPGQTSDMKVAVVDIKKSLLDQILPDQQALNFLTHIRQGKDGDTSNATIVGEDLAVLIANRLPESGATSTVYLVSLEDRYAVGGTFDHDANAGDDDMIRLVKLHSWSFTSTEHFKISTTFLDKASDLSSAIKTKLEVLKDQEFFTRADFENALTGDAGLSAQEFSDNEAAIFADFAYGDFAMILKHLDRTTETLRLPDVNATANPYLQSGFYPLPHKLRGGEQTVSWYHGPLSPDSNAESISFPAEGSDALLRYYEAISMFDVSYAAAWELGRLLALQNTRFSTELYQWKRSYAKAVARQDQITAHSATHLHGGNRDHATEALPATVEDWLEDLKLLKGIPFNYLVPDEQLLPAESIRFFQLDQLWMESLLDGAFSIGRVTSNDHSLDTTIAASETALTSTPISGFILRSEVVSGWPGMQIEGYSTTPDSADFSSDSAKMIVLRQEYLSKNVLLCLFKKDDNYTGDEDLQTLDLHLKPEVLHFGVNPKDGGGYEKVLRDNMGAENATPTVNVGFPNSSVMDLSTLLTDIQTEYTANNSIAWKETPTSADLALQLLEGVERVRFVKASS